MFSCELKFVSNFIKKWLAKKYKRIYNTLNRDIQYIEQDYIKSFIKNYLDSPEPTCKCWVHQFFKEFKLTFKSK